MAEEPEYTVNTHDDAEANIPIYASIEEAGAQAQQLSSLNDLVAEPKKPAANAQEDEFERLRREALAAHNAEPQPLVAVEQPTKITRPNQPSQDARVELARKAMQSSTLDRDDALDDEGGYAALSAAPDEEAPAEDERHRLAKIAMEQAKAGRSGSSLPGGPTAEDRARLAQAAMSQSSTSNSGTLKSGPSLEERARLAKEAMAREQAKAASGRAAMPPAPSQGPSQEDRMRLAQMAMQSAQSSGPPARDGPSQEDRMRLAQMAMAQAKSAPASSSGRMPSEEERRRLAAAAMGQHR